MITSISSVPVLKVKDLIFPVGMLLFLSLVGILPLSFNIFSSLSTFNSSLWIACDCELGMVGVSVFCFWQLHSPARQREAQRNWIPLEVIFPICDPFTRFRRLNWKLALFHSNRRQPLGPQALVSYAWLLISELSPQDGCLLKAIL